MTNTYEDEFYQPLHVTYYGSNDMPKNLQIINECFNDL
jgi:hypothetical protein